MLQAAFQDGQFLDPFPFCQNGVGSAEIGVGWGKVAEALVVTVIVVVLDEGGDRLLECSRQVVVLQQDAALQGLVPVPDPAMA